MRFRRIAERSAGGRDFEENDVHEFVHTVLRLDDAVSKGTARRNLRMMSQVIVGLKRHRLFEFNNFQRWATLLETLTHDEILVRRDPPHSLSRRLGQRPALREGLQRTDLSAGVYSDICQGRPPTKTAVIGAVLSAHGSLGISQNRGATSHLLILPSVPQYCLCGTTIKVRSMADINFLFRFRNLVAPTIERHRQVIREHNWCWWGWWKRPSENSRSDIWDALAGQAESGKPVLVGLFDSGTGDVYEAVVTGVIKPGAAQGGLAEHTIKVPAPELEHVPSYYRESAFSRAWMKVTEIRDPIAFFGKFSFAEAPRLPNYTESTLRRFVNKRIVNADELRLMDTTIWRIRTSQPADPSEQILLSVQAVPEAISAELVRCKSNAILHLTDLHFATGSNRKQHVWRYDIEQQTRHTMIEATTSALNSAKQKIGLVIVSGDFTFTGAADEFYEARASLLRLLQILDLSPDHLVIVPGNHDIQWTTSRTYDPNAEIVEAPAEARRNYEEFYRQIFRHEPSRHLAMARRFVLPNGTTVEVCALNSSSLETGKKFLAGMGRIDEGGFIEVANKLDWGDAQTLALRLLVIHHHLALTEDLEPAEGYGKGYGLAVDAVRVQRLAAHKGVHLALHGHKHRAFIWRSTVYELPEQAQERYRVGELSIIGGGSAGSVETDGLSNYFNVIAVEPGLITLTMFRAINAGIFGRMQRWTAELSLSKSSGGLKLGDWDKA
jgi:3',5'-cyclic AMP phosphodiesterase CpdA